MDQYFWAFSFNAKDSETDYKIIKLKIHIKIHEQILLCQINNHENNSHKTKFTQITIHTNHISHKTQFIKFIGLSVYVHHRCLSDTVTGTNVVATIVTDFFSLFSLPLPLLPTPLLFYQNCLKWREL